MSETTLLQPKAVLVQAGHAPPREPGFESGTGTAYEISFTLAMQKALCALLDDDPRFQAVPVPGDIPDGIEVDAAIFLHGDGSVNPHVSGYCFGYPDHPTNKKLADLIAVEFNLIPGHPAHRTDNYTGGLRGYYGYRKVLTTGPEVLVEHGFLTNPAEREWMFANVDEMAQAEYRALLMYFGMLDKNAERLAVLRAWILAKRAAVWTWEQIKRTANWVEFRRRGGQ